MKIIENIGNWMKKLFIRKIELDVNKRYIYILENANQKEIQRFSSRLSEAKYKKQDIVTSTNFKIIPAECVKKTMHFGLIETKTKLLKILNKKISSKEFNNISQIVIMPDGISIEKFEVLK